MDRRLRLREDADIRRVRGKGRAVAEGPLVVRVLANGLAPPRNRYAVVAGKKLGNAVQRNRAKRLLREALRRLHPTLRPGFDVVVIVRGAAAELPDFATTAALLERLLRRAGVGVSESASRRVDESTSRQGEVPVESAGGRPGAGSDVASVAPDPGQGEGVISTEEQPG